MNEMAEIAPLLGEKHIVDVLIEERARRLLHRPLIWSLIRRVIYPLLQYETAVRLVDEIAPMSAPEVMELVSGLLGVRLTQRGTENIPRHGRFMLVANHPTGIADGIAVYDALKGIRPDMCFFANRDALRVCPRLAEIIIPVEWVLASRSKAKTRAMVKRTAQAFKDENAIVIFPSGRPAVPDWQGLREQGWFGTTINLARRNKTPIVPLHMSGRNSLLYYFFHFTSTELHDMCLFNELLNKKNYPFQLTFGPIIQPSALEGDADEVAARLKTYVEDELPADPARPFSP